MTKPNKLNHRNIKRCRVEQAGFQRRNGVGGIPQGKVIAFPQGGDCSSQERWLLQNPGISLQQKSHNYSLTSLFSVSHSRLFT